MATPRLTTPYVEDLYISLPSCHFGSPWALCSPDCPPTVKVSNVRDGTEHPYSESGICLRFRPMIQPLLKEQCLHADHSCPWHNNVALWLCFMLLTHSQQS